MFRILYGVWVKRAYKVMKMHWKLKPYARSDAGACNIESPVLCGQGHACEGIR